MTRFARFSHAPMMALALMFGILGLLMATTSALAETPPMSPNMMTDDCDTTYCVGSSGSTNCYYDYDCPDGGCLGCLYNANPVMGEYCGCGNAS